MRACRSSQAAICSGKRIIGTADDKTAPVTITLLTLVCLSLEELASSQTRGSKESECYLERKFSFLRGP